MCKATLLKITEERSTHLLPLLPGPLLPLWSGMLVLIRVLLIGLIGLFKNYSYSIRLSAKKKKKKKKKRKKHSYETTTLKSTMEIKCAARVWNYNQIDLKYGTFIPYSTQTISQFLTWSVTFKQTEVYFNIRTKLSVFIVINKAHILYFTTILIILFTQPLRSGRIWHKVNLQDMTQGQFSSGV